MEPEDARGLADDMRRTVSSVLSELCGSGGCPCGSARFAFWAGKEQGPGWQDNLQNALVEAALALPFFETKPPAEPEYWLEADVRCGRCGASWRLFSVEWRMMAHQKRLVPAAGVPVLPDVPEGLMGDCIAATCGHEPSEGRPTISPGDWAVFMRNGPCRTRPYSRTCPGRLRREDG